MKTAAITGLGLWVPQTVVESPLNEQAEHAQGAKVREGGDPLLDILVKENPTAPILRYLLENERKDPKRGTRERRVSEGELNAYGEATAAKQAIAKAGIKPEAISHVLSWCLVPDDIGPHAAHVAYLAGIEHAAAIDVDVACASVVAQLELATALLESGRATHVLCTQAHLLSRTLPADSRLAPYVGDAATAFVVSLREGKTRPEFCIQSDGSYADAVVWTRADGSTKPWFSEGSCHIPGTRDRSRAQHLVAYTLQYGAETIQQCALKAGVDVRSVEVLATVQPRGWVPEGIARALDLPADRAPSTFARYAHLGRLKKGSRVALYAQGAGFTRAAALLDWA
jgi:3-oxoacyl-[acyl-carrier-protein] synthase III